MPRVLVVDDSELILRVMSQLIGNELKFEPITAADYQQTEVLLSQTDEPFLAAIVDLNLPDATDGEAVDLVLQHGIPTIVLSGNFDEQMRQRILAKGVVDYIVKEGGFSYEYALRIIRRLDQNRRCCTLVVDDSSASRSALKHLLTLNNLPVLEACDGLEALEILEVNPDISLIITDNNMPKMDGTELVRRVRKHRSYEDLSIIGLSGEESGAVSAKFIKFGANDFLRKPFSFEELQCRIMQNLETMEHVSTIRRSANEDYLTKLNNRRHFFEVGESRLKKALRRHSSICVALMDLDFFKQVNDTYGHDVGDAVLVHLAKIIEDLPDSVLSARVGGEEFALLFSDLSLDEVLNQLEEFRRKVEQTEVLHGENRLKITLSIGVSDRQESLDRMLKVADEGLYKAKEAGRNQVAAG